MANHEEQAQINDQIEQQLDWRTMELTNEDVTRGLAAANALGTQGKVQLHEHVIIGEDEAIEATLAAQLTGADLHYVSMHGGGKTKLLRFGHLLIDGIDKVATTPARADLTGGEFTGTNIPLVITERDNKTGEVKERSIENTAKGIVNEGTQVLNLNELGRISPYALNAGLEIQEAREIETSKGILSLKAFEYIVATSNPFTKASRQNQFRAHTAGLSRFPSAVVMGDEKYWEAITKGIIMDYWKPTPEGILAPVDLDELHLARRATPVGIIFPETQRKLLMNASMSAARVLRDNGAEELPGRIAVHMLGQALAIAALAGETHVNDEAVKTAVERKVTSIAVGLRPKDEAEITGLTETILEKAA